VANLLRDLKYSCQANQKIRECGNHPDRDAQFAYINRAVKAVIAAGGDRPTDQRQDHRDRSASMLRD
jgi:hypothetical protein